MEKKINPVLKRLSEFADSKGGFAEIGRRIQKHPSMFYNLVRRDAVPSLNTLTEIAEAFPDLDLNYLIRGVSSGNVDAEALIRLRREVEMKQATIEVLTIAAKKTTENLSRSFRKGAANTQQDTAGSGVKETTYSVLYGNLKPTDRMLLSGAWSSK